MQPPLDIDANSIAMFLDLDGTLAEIADHPALVEVSADTISLLARLSKRLDGALAIVSGRPISDIDALLKPLILPVAGVHGASLRFGDGRYQECGLSADQIDSLATRAATALVGIAGVLIERKPGAIAIHFRAAPEAEASCRSVAEVMAAAHPGLVCQPGKMVFEIMPRGIDKGLAIAAFLKDEHFRDRKPVFAGDDTTDESGFAAVEAVAGISIKIGAGPSRALYRLESPAALAAWLGALAGCDRVQT